MEITTTYLRGVHGLMAESFSVRKWIQCGSALLQPAVLLDAHHVAI